MILLFDVEVEVEPGENLDPRAIMDAMARAVEQRRVDGALTAPDDGDTVIKGITFFYLSGADQEGGGA